MPSKTRIEIPPAELDVRFSRSGGPGGQNVNRRDTRVEVLLDLDATTALTPRQKQRVRQELASRIDRSGRLRVVASAGRTQRENRVRATGRLEQLLADALRPPPPPRRPTRPSVAAENRRIAAKKARARTKKLRGRPAEED